MNKYTFNLPQDLMDDAYVMAEILELDLDQFVRRAIIIQVITVDTVFGGPLDKILEDQSINQSEKETENDRPGVDAGTDQ